MLYTIKKTVMLMPDGERKILKRDIPTNDIEVVRKALHTIYECDSVLFTYNEEISGSVKLTK